MASRMQSGSSLLMNDNDIPGVGIHKEIREHLPAIEAACRKMGLDYFPIVIEFMTYDEISEIASYGGFPIRYAHWRWGMEYEKLSTSYEYGHHRISEMVINNDPCVIYCLDSNTMLDNIDVIAHAIGHNDFFKNNVFFEMTHRKMINKMANHASRVRRYMARWGREKVTEFIDHCLRLQTLIDPAKAWSKKTIKKPHIKDERDYRFPERLHAKHEYMDEWVNTEDYINRQHQKIDKEDAADYLNVFQEPSKDVFGYLRDHAPLKPWQQDVISMLYDESIYVAPQRMTKMINEGWACVHPKTYLPTSYGIVQAKEVVENKHCSMVWDGTCSRDIVNWFEHKDKDTVSVVTKRGYELCGSHNHRIRNKDNEWRKLEDLSVGDHVGIYSSNVWSDRECEINFEVKPRLTYNKIKKLLGKSNWRFSYYRCGRLDDSKAGDQVVALSERYDQEIAVCGATQLSRRKAINYPRKTSEDFAQFLGYMIGDGHISVKKRTLGLTTGDIQQSNEYTRLVEELFGLETKEKWDNSSKNGRWRLSVSSRNLQDFLVHLGMKIGKCARKKTIPDCIMRSPKEVMSSFLRAYFDCDGYAGKAGVILSTSSEELGRQVQIVLLNYGILSSRKSQKDGCWQVRVTGKSAIVFGDEIGFGLDRKQDKLNQYIGNHKCFCKEKWKDEIVKIENSKDTVYDISVEETHRYSAQGFMNHNSFVDFHIMSRECLSSLGQGSDSGGIWQYAKHKWKTLGGKWSENPYKLGFELLMDIEDRWNKGKFGKEWEECEDMREKKNWDKKLGLGMEKVFEIRKNHNDFTLISEFFTSELCEKLEYYHKRLMKTGEDKIVDRDFGAIKKQLMSKYLNGSLPDIRLTDPNHQNKGWMMLQHYYTDFPLYDRYARETLTSLWSIWQNICVVSTQNSDGMEYLYICNGPDAKDDVHTMSREQYEKDFMS